MIYFIGTTLVGHVMKTNISLAYDNTYFTNLQLTSIYHTCLQKFWSIFIGPLIVKNQIIQLVNARYISVWKILDEDWALIHLDKLGKWKRVVQIMYTIIERFGNMKFHQMSCSDLIIIIITTISHIFFYVNPCWPCLPYKNDQMTSIQLVT